MKVLVLYRPNSEHARVIEDFIERLKSSMHAPDLDVLNIDTREGSSTASLYDIMSYPAILVLQTDGALLKSWEGDMMPLIDEVVGYVHV
jgi:hypothetical protein